MRNYFILNGVDSRDYGVYISGQGTFSAPQKAYTFYNVPGRNGAILGSENRLENINVSYEAFIYTDFDNNIAKFRTFLLSLNGYQRLSDSYHPDEYRYAVYQGPFEPKVTKMNDSGSFVITFSCKPQRYLLSGDTVYQWEPNEGQEVSGTSLTVYAPKIDTSVLNWAYEDHGITRTAQANRTTRYSFKSLSDINVKIDGTTVYTAPMNAHVTKATANLITGSLSIKASVTTTPTTGWTLYATNVFRVSVSGWSGVNAARRLETTQGSIQVGEYPVYPNLTNFNANVENYGVCYDSGYLYCKDIAYSTASDFMSNQAGFSVDRTLTTAQTVLITPYVPSYPDDFMTVSGLTTYETWTMKYQASNTMANPTEFPSSPLIRAYGNGVFEMDGVRITITNASTYTDIDCDLMDCYEGTTNRNNDVSFSTYDFPKLRPGENAVSIVSGITLLEITPRWWRV